MIQRVFKALAEFSALYYFEVEADLITVVLNWSIDFEFLPPATTIMYTYLNFIEDEVIVRSQHKVIFNVVVFSLNLFPLY